MKDAEGAVETEYLVPDDEGSTSAVVSGSGVLLDRVAYGPWGSFVDPASGGGVVSAEAVAGYTHVTYTGGELIARAGLIDLGARMYDPGLGQYLSPDPLAGGDPYVYVRDNPLSRIDPLGLSSTMLGKIEVFGPYLPIDFGGGGGGGGGLLQQVGVMDSFSIGLLPAPRRHRGGSSCQKHPVDVRVAQGLVGSGEAIGGLVQAIGGVADILASVAGAPETFGASLLVAAPGGANLTLGSVTFGDGLSLIHAAFTGSGNAPTLEGSIGQQYGGVTGEHVGDAVGFGGQVASAALSPPTTAEAALLNAAMMLGSNLLPSAGPICGQ